MAILGTTDVSATATPTRKEIPADTPHILRNTGSNAVYFRRDPGQAASTLAGANDTAMRAVGGSLISAGGKVEIPAMTAYIDFACLTGQTTTVKIDAGSLT